MVKLSLENIKGHTLRYALKLKKLLLFGKTDIFDRVSIEIINTCTRRCRYCPMSLDKNFVEKIMTRDLFYKIIAELKKIKFKGDICLVNFGEPLMDDRLEEFVSYIKKELNIKPHFFTNGDLLTIERFRRLVDCGLNYMNITQHGEIPSKNLKEFFKKATKKDSKYFIFEKLTENSPLFSRSGIKVKNRIKMSRFCRAPSNMVPIRADGIVPICCNDYFNKVIQGDLNKQSIMEVWNDPINKKRREELSKAILIPKLCKICVYGDTKNQ